MIDNAFFFHAEDGKRIQPRSRGLGDVYTRPEIQFREIERMKKDLTEIYVKHNSKGKTYAEFEAGMDRDNFLTAQEAIDWGLADEIVEKR